MLYGFLLDCSSISPNLETFFSSIRLLMAVIIKISLIQGYSCSKPFYRRFMSLIS